MPGGARTLGHQDVADVPQRNLASEQATLEKAKEATERVAAVTPKNPPDEGGVMDKVKQAIS